MSDAATSTPAAEPAVPTLEQVAAEVFGSDEPAPVVEGAAAEPSAVEPAKEPAQPSKEERAGARLVVAKRAEARAARERAELAATKEAQQKREAALDARDAEQRLIDEDPTKYFELKKKGSRAIAEHLEKLAGTYKPEAVEGRKLTAVEEKVAALEAEIKRRDDAEQQRTARDARAKAEQEAGAAFVAHIGGAADKFPHLTQEFTEDEAVKLAFSELTSVIGRDASGKPVTRVQAYIAEHGVPPDHDVIAEHLDSIAKARIEARAKSGWRKPGESAETASQAANGQQRAAVPPAKGTSPRTLTSREASTRASAPKPWSQEAADEESIRILEASFRKGG